HRDAQVGQRREPFVLEELVDGRFAALPRTARRRARRRGGEQRGAGTVRVVRVELRLDEELDRRAGGQRRLPLEEAPRHGGSLGALGDVLAGVGQRFEELGGLAHTQTAAIRADEPGAALARRRARLPLRAARVPARAGARGRERRGRDHAALGGRGIAGTAAAIVVELARVADLGARLAHPVAVGVAGRELLPGEIERWVAGIGARSPVLVDGGDPELLRRDLARVAVVAGLGVPRIFVRDVAVHPPRREHDPGLAAGRRGGDRGQVVHAVVVDVAHGGVVRAVVRPVDAEARPLLVVVGDVRAPPERRRAVVDALKSRDEPGRAERDAGGGGQVGAPARAAVRGVLKPRGAPIAGARNPDAEIPRPALRGATNAHVADERAVVAARAVGRPAAELRSEPRRAERDARPRRHGLAPAPAAVRRVPEGGRSAVAAIYDVDVE